MRTTRTIVLAVCVAAAALALAGCVPASQSGTGAGSTTATADLGTPVVTRENALDFTPGTTWSYVSVDSDQGLALTLPLKGPWVLIPDVSVESTTFTNEVLATQDAPEGKRFPEAEFAIKSTDQGTGSELYLFRGVTDEALLGYGRAEKDASGEWVAQVYDPPTISYPLGLKVGDTVTVRETDQFTIKATAVSISQAKTPAGVFERAVLVRYDFTMPDGSSAGPPAYWILAPGVEWVAYIVPKDQLTPDADISGIIQISILTEAPAK